MLSLTYIAGTMKLVSYIFIALCCVHFAQCKTFTRCDLARELRRQGFAQNELPQWVCIVEAESSRRTEVVGGPNSDGSYDYGLFQINDRYWCSTGPSPGKGCNMRCKDLITDDITRASLCAKTIYKTQGIHAWVGWTSKCQGKPLPDLRECGL